MIVRGFSPDRGRYRHGRAEWTGTRPEMGELVGFVSGTTKFGQLTGFQYGFAAGSGVLTRVSRIGRNGWAAGLVLL
jgi:hypothetical protein